MSCTVSPGLAGIGRCNPVSWTKLDEAAGVLKLQIPDVMRISQLLMRFSVHSTHCFSCARLIELQENISGIFPLISLL